MPPRPDLVLGCVACVLVYGVIALAIVALALWRW
jgi:hypothetical protein